MSRDTLPRQSRGLAAAAGPPPRRRRSIYELPPLELECMKVLWRLGEASVRDIREHLAGDRPLAYTTVETIMNRLARKGAVSRQKVGKAHRYTPRYDRAEARAQAVEAVVEHFFGGSREALRAHLEGRAAGSKAAAGEPHQRRGEPPLDTSLL